MSERTGFTRAHTKCQRGGCGALFHEHGPDGACPDGRGAFRKHVQVGRASASFSAAEVELLDAIRKGLAVRHRDISHLARHPAFVALSRKVQTMSAALKSAASGAAPSSPGVASPHAPSAADASQRAGG